VDDKKYDDKHMLSLAQEMSKSNMVSYEELPKYDLFLSQVIDYLNDKFTEDKYTNNIVQNYVKSEVISKPEDGKKRGYTKVHLAQLVLLSYMRPILTTEEIKKVFKLAFNEINLRTDDIISWEDAYKIFSDIQKESFEELIAGPLLKDLKLDPIVENLDLDEKDKERIKLFLQVLSLVAQASVIKKIVQKLVNEYHDY